MAYDFKDELLKVFVLIDFFLKVESIADISTAIFSKSHFCFEFSLLFSLTVETVGEEHFFCLESRNLGL